MIAIIVKMRWFNFLIICLYQKTDDLPVTSEEATRNIILSPHWEVTFPTYHKVPDLFPMTVHSSCWGILNTQFFPVWPVDEAIGSFSTGQSWHRDGPSLVLQNHSSMPGGLGRVEHSHCFRASLGPIWQQAIKATDIRLRILIRDSVLTWIQETLPQISGIRDLLKGTNLNVMLSALGELSSLETLRFTGKTHSQNVMPIYSASE